LAERKEIEVVAAVRSDPAITQAEIVALVRGEGTRAHTAALRAGGGLTLKQAFDRCLKSPTVWGRIKAYGEYVRNCKALEDAMGANKQLASVSPQDIKDYTNAMLAKGAAPATINRHLACLRRMFNVALGADDNAWPDAPKVFPKVKQLKERGARQYFMSPDDEARIFNAVLAMDDVRPGVQGGPPRKRDAYRYHALFMVLVESGLRLNEALGLLREEAVMPRGSKIGMFELFRPEVLKTGRVRSVPMTEKCRQVLEGCMEIKGGPFADLTDRRAQDIWTRAKKAAGITHRDAVIHCLRHTCASRLLESGQDLKVVQEWLGHSSIETTAGYAHLATSMLTRAASGLTRLRSEATAEA
jgi:site-specific recombinase XerD